MVKQRKNMQVAPEFNAWVKKLQGQIMKEKGVKPPSTVDITREIATGEEFDMIEGRILGNRQKSIDFKIKLDRRLL